MDPSHTSLAKFPVKTKRKKIRCLKLVENVTENMSQHVGCKNCSILLQDMRHHHLSAVFWGNEAALDLNETHNLQGFQAHSILYSTADSR